MWIKCSLLPPPASLQKWKSGWVQGPAPASLSTVSNYTLKHTSPWDESLGVRMTLCFLNKPYFILQWCLSLSSGSANIFPTNITKSNIPSNAKATQSIFNRFIITSVTLYFLLIHYKLIIKHPQVFSKAMDQYTAHSTIAFKILRGLRTIYIFQLHLSQRKETNIDKHLL